MKKTALSNDVGEDRSEGYMLSEFKVKHDIFKMKVRGIAL